MQITLLLPDPRAAEERAARAWLERQHSTRVSVQALQDFEVRDPEVVWIHSGGFAIPGGPVRERLAALRPRGGFLFTGSAALLPSLLGWEPPPLVTMRTWADADDELFFHDTFTESPRVRGHAGFGAHPLLATVHRGVYTWAPVADEPYLLVRYRLPDWPAQARVIATERAYIHVAHEYATIWETEEPGAPRRLSIGAHFPFAPRDPRFRSQHEQLARAALRYMERRPTQPRSWWRPPGTAARHDAAQPVPRVGSERPDPLTFADAPLSIPGGHADDPVTLAGRRAMAAGTEGAGVQELWVHPLRALQGLEVSGARPVAAELTPIGMERTFTVEGVTVDERAMVPHELGALVIEWSAAAEVTFELRWRCDLRLMWPYPAGALGDLRWHHDAQTLVVRGADEDHVVCCHFGAPPERWQVTESTGGTPHIELRTRVTLGAGQRLRFLAAATSSGPEEIEATLAALRDPLSLARARTAALRRLELEGFTIDAPDGELGTAVDWAKHRLDSFLVTTPGLGRSLVAGYGPSRPGWNDGRPGYAWYFGRDAVWTALASLAVGDFAPARDVIRFLGELQDISGKILHECTTSGLVHYDAADATPLYLLLVARLHAWTGETAFVAGEWERVKRALAFCIATDTDEDGLIENPRVGHGWIEFGPLGGGKVTYYNAGIWAAALHELERTAQDLGDRTLSRELHRRAQQARTALEERFYDEEAGRYALKAWQEDAGWRTDLTPTATHAVPLLLGMADPERATSWLDAVASGEFSAPWGVRMIAASHPLFNPKSYHGGAVWPLYTGWASWAEYEAGRGAAGYAHLLANARLMRERAKGAWDEVLHGTSGEPAGVCADQAWSAAMVVAPIVYGMLGAEPDAFRNRLRLRPQLPAHWDRCEVGNLCVGDAAVALRYERHHDRLVFRVEQERGTSPLTLILEPVIAAGALRAVRIDGAPAQLSPRPFGSGLLVPVQLVLDAERVVELDVEPLEA